MSTTTFGSATEAIKDLKDTINGSVGAAVSAIDAKRAPIASGIETAASKLQSGADTLEGTAHYLRKNKVGDMWDDLADVVKAHPTAALIGAVVVGFAAGRMLRR
jgi:phage-related protein